MVIGFVALAAWVWLAVFHGRFWRVKPVLTEPRGSVPAARVVAVIPARNEAGTIARTVESLRAQTHAVYVVDDNSADGTAELARAAGAVVVPGEPLPEGWTGKMWAVSQGVAAASASQPDYLLLTDADIEHSPGSVRSLLTRAEGFDLVSVMVRLNCDSPAERLLIPAFVFFFFMLYPPAWGRGAAGGCMLIRPDALARAGGIEAIRGELIDDCALAGAVRRSGGRVWLGLSDGTRSIRPYPHFSDVRAMIARTAFTQLRYSALLLAGTIVGMGLLYVAPLVTGWAGLAAFAVMSAIYLPLVRFYRQPWWMALTLPAAAVFYSFATVESAVRYWSGRGGAWKGRHQASAIRRSAG